MSPASGCLCHWRGYSEGGQHHLCGQWVAFSCSFSGLCVCVHLCLCGVVCVHVLCVCVGKSVVLGVWLCTEYTVHA